MRISLAPGLIAAIAVLAAPLSPQQPDFSSAHEEALHFLEDLVRIDTSSPPGNETQAARYIQAVLAGEGIESHIYEREPGRGNLVARLKGNGSKRPILLMGHLDVVGVERDAWTEEPFGAVIKDGYLYGRGSQDDKGMVAVALEVFLMLHRSGMALDRDVILMAEAGEEGSPQLGVQYMIDEHFSEIDAEFALNEGGGIIQQNGRWVVSVATTEKVSRGMRLIAHGTSGHGSRPLPDNPIVHLAAAVAKFGSWQYPMRLSETTREYFRRMAEVVEPQRADLYRNLENPSRTAEVQEKLRLTDFTANSMLRTSISPTIIEGGFRSNVIPAEASVRLDIRALPDDDTAWLVSELTRIIDDPAVEIVPPGRGRPSSPPMPMDSDLFRALEVAQASVFPGGLVVPTMVTGATDSAQLRAKGVKAYGIGSVTDEATGSRAHGNDERTLVEGVGLFVRFLYRTVTEVAGG
jgi:acetylornithine deacetylase/succinyl-diaminopimelate desuccinylase-like protein